MKKCTLCKLIWLKVDMLTRKLFSQYIFLNFFFLFSFDLHTFINGNEKSSSKFGRSHTISAIHKSDSKMKNKKIKGKMS